MANARDQMKLVEAELGRIRSEIEKLRVEEALVLKMLGKISGTPQYDAMPDESAAVIKRKADINYLGMQADLAPQAEQGALKHRDTIRAAFKMAKMLNGATMKDLEIIYGDFDTKREYIDKDVKPRARQIVKRVCHRTGYGTKSSEDGKTITLVTGK